MPTVTALSELDATPHADLFPDRDPRVVRLALDAGDRVPRHQHPDATVVLSVREGRLDLTVGDDVSELAAGDVVRFDGGQGVSPAAVTDATALVVFVPDA